MGWPAHWTKQIRKIHKLEQQHADEYIKTSVEREPNSKAPDLRGDSKQCVCNWNLRSKDRVRQKKDMLSDYSQTFTVWWKCLKAIDQHYENQTNETIFKADRLVPVWGHTPAVQTLSSKEDGKLKVNLDLTATRCSQRTQKNQTQ